MGHLVSSPREREKRDKEIVEEMKEEQGRKRNRNESEETEEIKTFPLYPYLLQGQQALPNCKPITVGHPSVCLFVCVDVLWPSQLNGVLSSVVILRNHTFTGQA